MNSILFYRGAPLRYGAFAIGLYLLSIFSLAEAAPFFRSDWTFEAGTSINALTDGRNWSLAVGSPELMSVESGGIEGTNLFSVALDGFKWAGVIKAQLPTDSVPDFYYRYYVRVYPAINFDYFHMHGLSETEESGGDNMYTGIYQVDATNWAPYFSNNSAQQKDGLDRYFYAPTGLKCGDWYRIEGHIHFYNHEVQAPTRMEVRVYDLGGTLIYGVDDFRGQQSKKALSAFYAEGKRYYQMGQFTTFKIGNNGPASVTGTKGKMFDACAAALSVDGWIGPYTPPPLDNTPPTITGLIPAANATDVAASANIVFHILDADKGVDQPSVVLKVNGQVASPFTLSGVPSEYVGYHNPPQDFGAGSTVQVTIDAQDKASPPNKMATFGYSFTVAGTSIRVAAPWQFQTANSHAMNGNSIFDISGRVVGWKDLSSFSSGTLLLRLQDKTKATALDGRKPAIAVSPLP